MQQVGSRHFYDTLVWAFFVGDPENGQVGVGIGTSEEDAKRRMSPQAGGQLLTGLPQVPVSPETRPAIQQALHAERAARAQQTEQQPTAQFKPRPFGSMGGKV